MNYNEIIVGHRVLVQSGEFIKEVAEVKGFSDKRCDIVFVKLSNGDITVVPSKYILKDFGL